MKAADFARVFQVADSDVDLSGESMDHLDGCGLREFEPVVATVRQVARLLRWQAMFIFSKVDGPRWDMEEMNKMRDICRRKISLLD